MKFLCVECDEAMKLERTDGPDKGSMTVVFACPSCRRQVAMLTNAMETQMVRSLGVKIGVGGGGNAAPMETLRGSLVGMAPEPAEEELFEAEARHGSMGSGKESEADASSERGKCPFTHAVNEAFERETAPEGKPVWTADALERLERIPEFVRPMIEKGIAEYAKETGVAEIDGAVMDEARERFGM